MQSNRGKISCAAMLVAGIAGGCVEDGIDDDVAETPRDGDKGTMDIRWPDGRIQTVPYVVHYGHAIWQGDIDLGPVPDENLRGYAIRNMGEERWPGNTIHWRIIGVEGRRQQIEDAIAQLERLTPIDFVEGIDVTQPFLAFRPSDEAGASFATGVGPDGIDPGDETDVNIHATAQVRTIMHELGHVLGLRHEQLRPERNQFIDVELACVDDDDEDQFEIDDDSDLEELEDYDIDSMMHYNSQSLCLRTEGSPLLGECICYPIVRKGFSHAPLDNPTAGTIPKKLDDGSDSLSEGDLRALWRMYEPALGDNEHDDEYGAAVATGDFDGDGFGDLAVGAPDEAFGGGEHTGVVFVYRGTQRGWVGWRIIRQPDDADEADGDRFGATLAVADFDGDDMDDLVVGAPLEDVGSTVNVGAFFLYPGKSIRKVAAGGHNQPEALAFFTQGTTGAGGDDTGDHFSSALVAADFSGDGVPDLAVGAEGEVASGNKTGYVYVLRWSTSSKTFLPWKNLAMPGTQTPGMMFGASLAAEHLDFDGQSRPELIVGAPADDVPGNGGRVFVFRGLPSSPYLTHVATLGQGGAGDSGDRLGAALAIGDIDRAQKTIAGTSRRPKEIMAGAPGKDNPTDSGRVFLYTLSYDSAGALDGTTLVTSIGQASVPGVSNQAGDLFGSSLAAVDVDFDLKVDLVVGVPGKELAFATGEAGVVETFLGGSGPSLDGAQMLATFPADDAHLGSSLAVGDFDGDGLPDLAVGAPTQRPVPGDPASGAVTVLMPLIPEIVTWQTLAQASSWRE